MMLGGCQHAVLMQNGEFPLVRIPMLALDLVNLGSALAPEGELSAQADLSDVLNRHRVNVAAQNVQELASSPPTFVAVAEFSSLTTWARAHCMSPVGNDSKSST